MRHWAYLYRRALGATVGCAFLGLTCSSWLTREVIEARLAFVTGSSAHIGDAKFWMRHQSIQLKDVRLGKTQATDDLPNASTTGMSISKAYLCVDPNSLLNRELVVKTALFEGLRIDGDTGNSANTLVLKSQTQGAASNWLPKQWIERLSQKQSVSLPDDLAMLQLARELQVARESNHRDLIAKNQQYTDELRAIQQDVGDLQNRLRDVPRAESSIDRALQLQQRLIAVRKAIQEDKSKLEAEIASLGQAKQTDLERFESLTDLSIPDCRMRAKSVLQEYAYRQVADWSEFVRAGRNLIQEMKLPSNLATGPGRNIDFGLRPTPDVLVQVAAFNGKLTLRNRPFELKGRVSNLTSTATSVEYPVTIHGELNSGDLQLTADLREQVVGGVKQSSVSLRTPKYGGGMCNLPVEELLDISWNATPPRIASQWMFDGAEKVSATIVINQLDPKFAMQWTLAGMESEAIETDGAFADLKELQFEVKVRGTCQNPELVVTSNLEEPLTLAIKQAMQDYLAKQQEALKQAIELESDKLTAELREQADRNRQEIEPQVVQLTAEVDAFATNIAKQLGLNPVSLMSKTPSDATLR